MHNSIFDKLTKQGYLLMDGSTGSLLIAAGIEPAKVAAVNIEDPDKISNIYKKYIYAGCDIISSNTFGVSMEIEKTSGYTKQQLIKSGVDLLISAVNESESNVFTALDIGPFGGLLEPFGTTTYAQALEHYKQVISAASDKTDILLLETFADINDIKAALSAAKEVSDKPVFASMTFGKNKKTYMGVSFNDFADLIAETKPAAAGLNCSLTPEEMLPVITEFKDMTDIHIFAQPNMGNPIQKDGITVYQMDKKVFAEGVAQIYRSGVSIVGGCCGSDDECMRLIKEIIK